VLFGGTALVPNIHSELTELVKTGKDSGCVTIVTTVYDFPNERKRLSGYPVHSPRQASYNPDGLPGKPMKMGRYMLLQGQRQ